MSNLVFFLITGGTLMLLFWLGADLLRAQEDPLADRLEELQSHAMVAPARAARRKGGTQGAGRVLYLVGLFPGGEDWIRTSERLLTRAGIRRKYALPLYIVSTLLWAAFLLAGTFWLQRDNLGTNLIGGVVAALLLGFLVPKMVLQRLVKR